MTTASEVIDGALSMLNLHSEIMPAEPENQAKMFNALVEMLGDWPSKNIITSIVTPNDPSDDLQEPAALRGALPTLLAVEAAPYLHVEPSATLRSRYLRYRNTLRGKFAKPIEQKLSGLFPRSTYAEHYATVSEEPEEEATEASTTLFYSYIEAGSFSTITGYFGSIGEVYLNSTFKLDGVTDVVQLTTASGITSIAMQPSIAADDLDRLVILDDQNNVLGTFIAAQAQFLSTANESSWSWPGSTLAFEDGQRYQFYVI